MKQRKKQPYIEIIDLKEEQKEYIKLCEGKSKKIQTYTSWEKHIKDLLLKFNSAEELYNFKRYCINQDRVCSDAPNLFGSYVILLITLILDKISPYLTILGIAVLSTYFICYGIKKHQNVIKGSGFFKDIIEIIEKLEKE
jgi:hypothetical protein